MSKATFDTITSIGLLAILFGTLIYFFFLSAPLPEVHVSYSTKECVKVINYDSRFDYTCKNYPKKYHHVWVE